MADKVPDLMACGTCGHKRANHQWHGNITDPEIVSVCLGDLDDEACSCAHFVDQLPRVSAT